MIIAVASYKVGTCMYITYSVIEKTRWWEIVIFLVVHISRRISTGRVCTIEQKRNESTVFCIFVTIRLKIIFIRLFIRERFAKSYMYIQIRTSRVFPVRDECKNVSRFRYCSVTRRFNRSSLEDEHNFSPRSPNSPAEVISRGSLRISPAHVRTVSLPRAPII